MTFSTLSGNRLGGSLAAQVSSTTGSPTISRDGTATIYNFTASGTLVIGGQGLAQFLLVGGGGGLGQSFSGGGGAGGFLPLGSTTDVKVGTGLTVPLGSVTVPVGTITITVGAGGAVSTTSSAGSDGTSTTCVINGVTYTAIGGGGGGGGNTAYAGRSGGSGGGGANGTAPGSSTQVLGYGYAGLTGDGSHGGPAGGAGGSPVVWVAGVGRQSSITGTATYYASGGAGDVCTTNASYRGVANSGDGGGGAGGSTGQSGVVIVRIG